ncbi:hypothetical protein [Ignatzschineria indica]
MTLNARDRRQNIQLLKQEHYDLVIMGGGLPVPVLRLMLLQEG